MDLIGRCNSMHQMPAIEFSPTSGHQASHPVEVAWSKLSGRLPVGRVHTTLPCIFLLDGQIVTAKNAAVRVVNCSHCSFPVEPLRVLKKSFIANIRLLNQIYCIIEWLNILSPREDKVVGKKGQRNQKKGYEGERGYSNEVKPCKIANLTKPGRSLMLSFCIMRLR